MAPSSSSSPLNQDASSVQFEDLNPFLNPQHPFPPLISTEFIPPHIKESHHDTLAKISKPSSLDLASHLSNHVDFPPLNPGLQINNPLTPSNLKPPPLTVGSSLDHPPPTLSSIEIPDLFAFG